MDLHIIPKHISQSSLLFLFVVLILGACKHETPISPTNPAKEEVLLNVPYGKNELQKADIYLPENRTVQSTRIVIVLHGGAWAQGDKADISDVVTSLRQYLGKDYAIVNMNYRLVTLFGYMLPMQTDDIRLLIEHMSKNTAQYHIKPEFILMGESAGGHLSMLYAYNYDKEKNVKAVVSIVGPSDLDDPVYATNPLFNLGVNRIIEKNKIPVGMTATAFASPVNWVNSSVPPTLLFYGKYDGLVPSNQQEAMKVLLEKNQICNEVVIYDEGGHSIARRHTEDIVTRTKSFLHMYLK